MEEQVVLVDEQDRELGVATKAEAHRKGLLHRAFSIFIFNSKAEILLQQRSFHKYHSGGLWSNACCSHPRPNEKTIDAAHRRLKEELGISVKLERIFEFVYKTAVNNDLTEHEYDHVYVGESDGDISIDKEEIKDYCFRDMQAVQDDMNLRPEKYSTWFRLAFPRVMEWWEEEYKEPRNQDPRTK